MFCEKCGHEIGNEAQFCSKCGNAVTSKDVPKGEPVEKEKNKTLKKSISFTKKDYMTALYVFFPLLTGIFCALGIAGSFSSVYFVLCLIIAIVLSIVQIVFLFKNATKFNINKGYIFLSFLNLIAVLCAMIFRIDTRNGGLMHIVPVVVVGFASGGFATVLLKKWQGTFCFILMVLVIFFSFSIKAEIEESNFMENNNQKILNLQAKKASEKGLTTMEEHDLTAFQETYDRNRKSVRETRKVLAITGFLIILFGTGVVWRVKKESA